MLYASYIMYYVLCAHSHSRINNFDRVCVYDSIDLLFQTQMRMCGGKNETFQL